MSHEDVRHDIPALEAQALEAFDADEDLVKFSWKSFQVGSLAALYFFLRDIKSDNV